MVSAVWNAAFWPTICWLPVALSLAVHTGWPSTPQVMASRPRPALAFDQYLIDYGPVDPQGELQARFVFRNTGTEPVRLTSVEPSCGCLDPFWPREPVAPNEPEMIVLRMQPAGELPGRKEYYALVRYHDGVDRETRLTFRLELPSEHLSVRPRAVMMYLNSDRSVEQTVWVTDNRELPADVLGVESSNPLVSVSVGTPRTSDEGARETPVLLQVVEGVPTGEHRGVVTVETSDPLSPRLRVPFILERKPDEASGNTTSDSVERTQ
jgi:hypothetical protein